MKGDSQLILDEPLVNSLEIAPMLGVKDRTVRKWAEAKEIPSYRTGSLIMFKKSEIRTWIESRRCPSKSEIELEKEKRKEEARARRESSGSMP